MKQRLQPWEKLAIATCLLFLAVVLYFASTAALTGMPEAGGAPEQAQRTTDDDQIADDTPLEGFGYGHKKDPDCQVKILDTLKK